MSRYLAQGAIGDLATAGEAVAKIVEDPHLPEVSCQVLRLSALEKGVKVPPCALVPVATSPGKGVGLRSVVKPLRLFVKFKENPALGYLIGAGVFATIYLLGYKQGRKAKNV